MKSRSLYRSIGVSLSCSVSFTFVYKTVKEYPPLCPSLSAMSAYVQPYSRKRGELPKYCLIIVSFAFLSTHVVLGRNEKSDTCGERRKGVQNHVVRVSARAEGKKGEREKAKEWQNEQEGNGGGRDTDIWHIKMILLDNHIAIPLRSIIDKFLMKERERWKM